MGAMQRLEAAIEQDLADEVARAIATGDYANADDVVRDALHLWRKRRDDTSADTRAAWDAAIASGDPIEGNFTLEEIRETASVRGN